jgi:Glycosyl hydrolases family 43
VSIVLVVVLAVTFVVSDVQTRRQLTRTEVELAAARSGVHKTLLRLAVAEASTAQAAGQRDGLQLLLTRTTTELTKTSSELTTTRVSLWNTSAGAAELNACLSGVGQALNQIAVGDKNGAVGTLSGVSTVCQAAQGGGGGPGGPVYPFDFADPYVLRVGDTYYAYGTNAAGGNVQVIRSTDLLSWSALGNALPKLARWALPNLTWAPAVLQRGGKFILFYAADYALTERHCISAAVSSSPRGPFIDSSTAPLTCQLDDQGGSIDPYPFVDASGNPYLAWKTDGLEGTPPAIWAQPLSADGLSTAGSGPTRLLTADQPWEAGVVEAPAIFSAGDGYVLLYSGNDWGGANYAIGAALCQGPLGPCAKPLDHPVLASQGEITGPGSPSVFTAGDGSLEVAFHAWSGSAVGFPNSRLLYVRHLSVAYGVPVIGAS